MTAAQLTLYKMPVGHLAIIEPEEGDSLVAHHLLDFGTCTRLPALNEPPTKAAEGDNLVVACGDGRTFLVDPAKKSRWYFSDVTTMFAGNRLIGQPGRRKAIGYFFVCGTLGGKNRSGRFVRMMLGNPKPHWSKQNRTRTIVEPFLALKALPDETSSMPNLLITVNDSLKHLYLRTRTYQLDGNVGEHVFTELPAQ